MISRRATVLLFALFAIAGLVLFQLQRDRLLSKRGSLTTEREGDAMVLFWSGEIALPMATQFAEAFAEHAGETERFILDFNSNGGSLSQGSRVIDQIKRMKRTHTIETRVRANRHCLSMCVPLFLQGERRIADARSVWMFHEPSARDYFDGSQVEQPAFEKRYYANRFLDTYFTPSPMNPQWREALRRTWVGQDIWKTGAELVAEDSRIITDLIH